MGLGALELEITGGVNGLTYHPDKSRSYTDTGDTFNPYPFGLANIGLSHDISEALAFSVYINRDNIQQNSIYAKLKSRTDYFGFEFGPFVGITDNFDVPDAGISGSLEFTIPGTAFILVSGLSTLGSQFEFTSNNQREAAEAKLGIWLGSTIISFSANTRSLTREKEEFLAVTDSLTRLMGSLEFFAKNKGFSGNFDFGYQTYSRLYQRGRLEFSDELNSWFGGFGINCKLSQPLRLKLGLEVPFLIDNDERFCVTPIFWFLSRAYAGLVYSFN